jgi:uncharacterized protein
MEWHGLLEPGGPETDFEWDPEKNDANIAARGIDFAWAVGVFLGPTIEWIDTRRDYGETRWIALGAVDGLELVLVYTWRGARQRIISARRAHDRERKRYREAFPEADEDPSG